MSLPTPLRGTLLFAHGSRDPLWSQPIEAVAQHIQRANPQALVRCAYLELCEPTLASAAAQLIALGAQHITVVPLFLGVGKHAREDLPSLMSELRQGHPEIEFGLQAAVGEDPRVTALLAQIAQE